MQFINRERETESLQDLFASPNAEMLVVYGRRRVGKTEQLRHFSERRPHIFFTATQTTDKNLMIQWSQLLWQHRNQPAIVKISSEIGDGELVALDANQLIET